MPINITLVSSHTEETSHARNRGIRPIGPVCHGLITTPRLSGLLCFQVLPLIHIRTTDAFLYYLTVTLGNLSSHEAILQGKYRLEGNFAAGFGRRWPLFWAAVFPRRQSQVTNLGITKSLPLQYQYIHPSLLKELSTFSPNPKPSFSKENWGRVSATCLVQPLHHRPASPRSPSALTLPGRAASEEKISQVKTFGTLLKKAIPTIHFRVGE